MKFLVSSRVSIKFVSVNVLIIFVIAIHYIEVDLLVKLQLGFKMVFVLSCLVFKGLYNRDLNYKQFRLKLTVYCLVVLVV